MLESSEVIAFVPTAKPAEARKFYEVVLGLRLIEENPSALVFDAHGVMLRLATVRDLTPSCFTVLGWKVADIAATVQGLATKGVVFQRYDGMDHDGLGIWKSPSGARVAWFKDPDGNTLSLTEF
jgi:catechol 2,3-dioxygenase-like lactoylglutathione lyase family enzyme